MEAMLKVKVDEEVLEYDENGIDDVETAVRAVISAHHSENKTNRIWAELRRWAEAWEEHPADGAYEGWAGVVAAVDEQLRIVPSDVDKTDGEKWAKMVLKLKRAWVKVSNDPTEAGQESNSLYAASTDLHDALTAIHSEAGLAMVLNRTMPAMFEVSNKYLTGGYECHQNAAKAARDIFNGYPFATNFLSAETERSDRERYMAAEWDQLAFSTRL